MNPNELAAGLRSLLGRNIDVSGVGSHISVHFTEADILSIIQRRPGAEKVTDLLSNPASAEAFLAQNRGLSSDRETRIICCGIFKSKANELFEKKQYNEARIRYMDGIGAIVGKAFKIPLPAKEGLRNQVYVKSDVWEKIVLMECCNGLARCMIELKDVVQALEWVEEVNNLWKNNYFSSEPVHFEWTDYNMQITEYFLECVTAYRIASDIFLDIGNTGTSVQRRWFGNVAANSMPSSLDTARVKKVVPNATLNDYLKLRHPEPKLVAKLTLENQNLQIRGSWKKLRTKKGGNLPQRSGFARFVWDGHLYVVGGQHKNPADTMNIEAAYLRDIWRLDLDKLDAWEQLPSYPVPKETLCGLQMSVHANKAYLFTGRPQVDFFDLTTRQWGSIETEFKRDDGRAGPAPWLYPGHDLSDYAMQMIDGHMYVFGGSHANARLGTNLFVVLDLATRKWTRLSGTVLPKPDYSCPGPRKWPASWVAEDRIFIMYGVADRQNAQIQNQSEAAGEAFLYSDFWSWSLTDRKWRREIISGNPPCPRAEIAATYNKELNQMILFGGYSPTYPTTSLETGQLFQYSYYADTFIWCPSTSKWKQVLTRGFPTYRAQSQLICDETTGKTLLYGGYTASDYVQSRKGTITRSFGDLWQLCIDQPGGYFEGVDLDDEARTAQAGPWQRCFTCGSAGPWKKCGGTCKGRAFFCDTHCLKEGWKEHKVQHKCRK